MKYVLLYINIDWHVLVTSATITKPYKNMTNNIELHKMQSLNHPMLKFIA